LFTSWKSRAAVFAVAATMAEPVLALTSPAGASGNSANAHACQKGGWQTLETTSGGSFANQDACVSYGAQGGLIFSPAVTVSPSPLPNTSTPLTISGTGFHPNTSVSLSVAGPGFGPITTGTKATDSSGAVSFSFGGLGCPSGGLANGSVVVHTITDASGVHASSPDTLTTGCGTP
jgi:hypothetical protein